MPFYERSPYLYLKRLLDIFLSVILIVLLFIPMLILGAAIAATSTGGAIFKQPRIGLNGEIFICYKFRTMYTNAPKNRPTAEFADAEKYITPIGRFLRKSSLDELPQLINVLRGDMSLVGPRPLIGEEAELHYLRKRCGVYAMRPGITGLAQINGRDMLSGTEKVRLDVIYTKRPSLFRDAKIIFKTVGNTLSGNGITR